MKNVLVVGKVNKSLGNVDSANKIAENNSPRMPESRKNGMVHEIYLLKTAQIYQKGVAKTA